jgi:pyruvate, water dikinase
VEPLFGLDQIELEHYPLVGNHALHLSLLAKKNYPVLPSFVIPAQRFREFLSSINWLEPFFADLAHSTLRLNLEDSQQLQTIARQIRTAILTTSFPESWQAELQNAIATHLKDSPAVELCPSIAFQTQNIPSDLDGLIEPQICWQTDLASGIKSLWAELFHARNILYWQKENLSLQQFQLAIVVQSISTPTGSGYLQFNGTTWDLLATWGLETAISYGESIPDLYRIDAHSGVIQFRRSGSHPIIHTIETDAPTPLQKRNHSNAKTKILNPDQLEQIQFLIKRLSNDFQFPMTLNWRIYDHQMFLTQIDYQENPIQLNDQHPEPNAIVSGLAAAPGQVVAIARVISEDEPLPTELPDQTVLVAKTVSPDWLPLLKQASAIVAEQGGMASHGAIVARELGIPAILHAQQATQLIRTGDRLRIDGNQGKAYPAEASETIPVMETPVFTMRHAPIATQLMVNLSQPELIDRATKLPIDGVGLLRSELMMPILLEQQHPNLWIQQGRKQVLIDRLATQIQTFVQAFAPRPVFYRTLDLRSHEFRSLAGADPTLEPNPMLGMRGTFSYMANPDLFELELAALHQVSATNLRLLLPFVRTIEEFAFCRFRVEQSQLSIPLWMMAEVPSVLFLLPDYVRAGAQGICIGTNDLTQLLLGIDRDQGNMAKRFNVMNPAVMSAIAQLIQSAHQSHIPCSICCPSGIDSGFIDRLIEWGVDSISVDLDAAEGMYCAIARSEQRLLLKQARNL